MGTPKDTSSCSFEGCGCPDVSAAKTPARRASQGAQTAIPSPSLCTGVEDLMSARGAQALYKTLLLTLQVATAIFGSELQCCNAALGTCRWAS